MGFYAEFSKYYDAIFPLDEAKLNFFNRIFTKHNVARVLDLACGTGEYALEFARSGLMSAGYDLEEGMIKKAQEKARKRQLEVRFQVADMRTLSEPAISFDGLICIGNSMAHLVNSEDLLNTVKGFRQQLKPGGIAIIQLVNYDRVIAQNLKGLPTKINESAGVVLERYYDWREDGLIDFRTILKVNEGNRLQEYHNIVVLNPLRKEILEAILYECGFTESTYYGDFHGNKHSVDSPALIAVAKTT